MAGPMRIRAAEAAGVTTVRVLMSHAMETGQRRGGDGNLVPAHYLSTVEAKHNGKSVLKADWSAAVSQNPFLSFKFKGAAKGDKVAVTWVDNKGETRTDEATIS